MFAIPQLRLIFLSLFIFSIAFSMERPEKEPIRYSKKNATDDKRSYKSNQYFNDEEGSFYGERPYKPKGEYSHPDEINSELNQQLIETAPHHIKLLILGLKHHHEKTIQMSGCKRLLLHGLPGNGKTSLARAIGLVTYGKYYFISASSLLSKWKNCHEDLRLEIDPLIKKGEPLVIIIDEMDQITDQYRNHNSSDATMPTAFCSLLDYCERNAPFLFFIGTTNNEKEDFPPIVISRFEDNMIYIPNPDASIREKIVNAQLNETKNNLDYIDKIILVERLAGRSCRNIVKVLERAIFYSFEIDNVVTWKLIDLAMEKIPCPFSESQLLADIHNTTEDRVKTVKKNKILLEKNHEVSDFLFKEKGYKLQLDSYNHAVESQITNYNQAVRSFDQAADHQRENHRQAVTSHEHAVESQTTNHNQAVRSFNQAANHHREGQTNQTNQHRENTLLNVLNIL